MVRFILHPSSYVHSATVVAGCRRLRWAALAVVLGLAAGGAVVVWRGDWLGPGPERLRADAEAELAAGRFDRAAASLARLARLGPPVGDDALLRARVAIARGRIEEALDELARVPDDHPKAAEARFRAGQLELRRDHLRAAEAAFLQALRRYPRLVQARRELIYIYGMQLRGAELSAQFRALSAVTPLSFHEALVWSLAGSRTSDPAEAQRALRRFVQADGGDRWSRLALAESLRQLGRASEANEVLARLPADDPDARAARARVALDQGDLAAVESLLAGGPADHPALALLRGRMALHRRDGPAAVGHLRAALAAAPDDRDVQFSLGQALRLTGDRSAAEPLLRAARTQDALASLVARAATEAGRSDPKLWLRLGAACEAANRPGEAMAWYKLAFGQDPADPEVQSALRRLESVPAGSAGTTAGGRAGPAP
jgi:tetratricopeptide (TPR) repeat protein